MSPSSWLCFRLLIGMHVLKRDILTFFYWSLVLLQVLPLSTQGVKVPVSLVSCAHDKKKPTCLKTWHKSTSLRYTLGMIEQVRCVVRIEKTPREVLNFLHDFIYKPSQLQKMPRKNLSVVLCQIGAYGCEDQLMNFCLNWIYLISIANCQRMKQPNFL